MRRKPSLRDRISPPPNLIAGSALDENEEEEAPPSPKIGRKSRKQGSQLDEPFSPKVPKRGREKGPWKDNPGGNTPTGDPTSPTGHGRRDVERRASLYKAAPGEEIYIPESHSEGALLLRPDNSFQYIHDCQAKFSEGVHGKWSLQGSNRAKLEPTGFGWCYQESFDAEEILGRNHIVTLCKDKADSDGRYTCTLPTELCQKFSWMDPTLPE